MLLAIRSVADLAGGELLTDHRARTLRSSSGQPSPNSSTRGASAPLPVGPSRPSRTGRGNANVHAADLLSGFFVASRAAVAPPCADELVKVELRGARGPEFRSREALQSSADWRLEPSWRAVQLLVDAARQDDPRVLRVCRRPPIQPLVVIAVLEALELLKALDRPLKPLDRQLRQHHDPLFVSSVS